LLLKKKKTLLTESLPQIHYKNKPVNAVLRKEKAGSFREINEFAM